MKKHYHLYYLLDEDFRQHPMDSKPCEEVKNIVKFYLHIKPARTINPHKGVRKLIKTKMR